MPHSHHLRMVFLLILLTSSFAQTENQEDQKDRNPALRPNLTDIVGQLFSIVFLLPIGFTLLYIYTIFNFVGNIVPTFLGFI